jgi:hypothetical protein
MRVPHLPRMLSSITMVDLRNELILHRTGRIVTSPSSTTMKGTATLRVVTSSLISNLLRLHEKLLWRVSCAPSSPAGSGGCMVLAPHLRMVVWPHKFQPHIPEKYDEMVNPAEFL